MAYFLSAVYLRTGDLICEPVHTDDHDELLEFANRGAENAVRLQLIPPYGDADVFFDFYRWNEELEPAPGWFDSDHRFTAFERMRDVLRRATDVIDGRIYYGRLLFVRDNTEIKCRGCRVFLFDRSHAQLWDASWAFLHNESFATLQGGSAAELYDQSRACAMDRSHVELYDDASATLEDESAAIVNDSARIIDHRHRQPDPFSLVVDQSAK